MNRSETNKRPRDVSHFAPREGAPSHLTTLRNSRVQYKTDVCLDYVQACLERNGIGCCSPTPLHRRDRPPPARGTKEKVSPASRRARPGREQQLPRAAQNYPHLQLPLHKAAVDAILRDELVVRAAFANAPLRSSYRCGGE